MLIQHDQWLYVRDEQGREGFVPLSMCHTEPNVSIEVMESGAFSMLLGFVFEIFILSMSKHKFEFQLNTAAFSFC